MKLVLLTIHSLKGKGMKNKKYPDQEVSFTCISGINYPFGSRNYLMKLVQEINQKDKGTFIFVAGNTVAGKELESELKHLIKLEGESVKRDNANLPKGGAKNPFGQAEKEEIERFFIEGIANELSDFFPLIEGVNYHIQIAEKVFDKSLGTKILEKLKTLRDDIRIFNDHEIKIPIRMPGVEDARGIVPSKTPWFYKIITGLMQRLVNSFVSRTYSPRPSLILVGCTGAGAHIPFYEGVPLVSIPTLHKIDEQLSTENMVGCVTIKLSRKDGMLRILPKTYDFRSVIFNERNFLIKENPSAVERSVLEALKSSSASQQVISFRINHPLPIKKKIPEKKIAEATANLLKRKLVLFNEKGNRYQINEEILGFAQIALSDFLKGSNVVRHVVESCRHIGALKSLYHTANEDLPELLVDADAFIDAGDPIQGIAHDYEYNGELLPIMNGFDKQQVLAAHIFKKNIMDTFRKRKERLEKTKKLDYKDFIKMCLIPFVFTPGNHPSWATHTKNSLVLGYFEDTLKFLLLVEVLRECRNAGYQGLDSDTVLTIVNEHVIRVGEDNLAEINGIKFGVKHPYKARSLSRSQRIQEVINFIYGSFYAFMKNVEQKYPDVSLAYVGNFHEAAAAHVSKFGRTLLGVMIGAYLKDTQFEVNKDKVVDIGPVKVEICFGQENQILYSQIEFINHINAEDQKLVMAKRIGTKMVLELCSKLSDIFDLPWRY